MQAGVGLLDTDVMPICIIIALDIVITLRSSINCSSLNCSPIVLFAFKREASSETYGPWVYFPLYIFRSIYQKYPAAIHLLLFTFTLQLSFISISIISHLCNVGRKCLIVCVGAYIGDLRVSPTGLIPWFLTEGNTYLYFDASPFPLQGKNQCKLKKQQLLCYFRPK